MTQTPSFRTVLRGYDPTEVDQRYSELSSALVKARQEAADRTVELTQAQQATTRLKEVQARLERQVSELQDAERKAAAPSYADLGERIGTILTLADEEADEIRRTASEEAATLRKGATSDVEELRRGAERYASETRAAADAEATRVVEKARQQADTILDDADREASARREEGEAFYENQRAKAAAAAADFEATLSSRRESAAEEFASQMAVHEQTLAEAEQRAASLATESEGARRSAQAEAKTLLDNARQEAEALVGAAREKAERVRRDSERELAAATARRDSITAQLSNVRQMLSTLGGAPMVEQIVGEVAEGSAPPAEKAEKAEKSSDDGAQQGGEPAKGGKAADKEATSTR